MRPFQPYHSHTPRTYGCAESHRIPPPPHRISQTDLTLRHYGKSFPVPFPSTIYGVLHAIDVLFMEWVPMGCGRAIYIPSILRTTVTNSLKKKSSEPHLHKANMYAQLRSAKPSKDLVPKAPLPPPLKWKRFEAEWSRFVEFATDPTNEQRPRDWTTWHADSNSNLSNTYSQYAPNKAQAVPSPKALPTHCYLL